LSWSSVGFRIKKSAVLVQASCRSS
jgi:hypothetical protein